MAVNEETIKIITCDLCEEEIQRPNSTIKLYEETFNEKDVCVNCIIQQIRIALKHDKIDMEDFQELLNEGEDIERSD